RQLPWPHPLEAMVRQPLRGIEHLKELGVVQCRDRRPVLSHHRGKTVAKAPTAVVNRLTARVATCFTVAEAPAAVVNRLTARVATCFTVAEAPAAVVNRLTARVATRFTTHDSARVAVRLTTRLTTHEPLPDRSDPVREGAP